MDDSWFEALPTGARPEVVADLARDASVVGLGANTREAAEAFRFLEETVHLLLDQGFGVLALYDNQRVGELYDRFVAGEDVDLDAALAEAWGPWRTTETRDLLLRLRARGGVRVVGISSARVLPEDYDRAVALLEPGAAAEVKALLDVVRVAHQGGEHVLRAHGLHPGTPFVDLARAARDKAAASPPSPDRETALGLLDEITAFHANAIGAGYDLAREEELAAGRILEHHRRTGERVVFWDTASRVAAHPGVMTGSHLRGALGRAYAAVHLTFGEGVAFRGPIPPPAPDSLEGVLSLQGGERTVDLRKNPPPTGTWRTRLIPGTYRAEEDSRHYVELPGLAESFDALVYLPRVTETHLLA